MPSVVGSPFFNLPIIACMTHIQRLIVLRSSVECNLSYEAVFSQLPQPLQPMSDGRGISFSHNEFKPSNEMSKLVAKELFVWRFLSTTYSINVLHSRIFTNIANRLLFFNLNSTSKLSCHHGAASEFCETKKVNVSHTSLYASVVFQKLSQQVIVKDKLSSSENWVLHTKSKRVLCRRWHISR